MSIHCFRPKSASRLSRNVRLLKKVSHCPYVVSTTPVSNKGEQMTWTIQSSNSLLRYRTTARQRRLQGSETEANFRTFSPLVKFGEWYWRNVGYTCICYETVKLTSVTYDPTSDIISIIYYYFCGLEGYTGWPKNWHHFCTPYNFTKY